MSKRTKEEREVIRGLIAVPRGEAPASDKELDAFLTQADASGLDPLKRHIYGQIRKNKDGTRQLVVLSSIDGFRAVAERSGVYEGQEGPLWLHPEKGWLDVWTGPGYPVAAKVGVWRSGFRSPCRAVARWDAYAQTKWQSKEPTDMWGKFCDLMLAKVAEALALRKAFPNNFGGLYTAEEMDQAQRQEREEAKATEHTKAVAEAKPGLDDLGLSEEHDAPPLEVMQAQIIAWGDGARSITVELVEGIAGRGRKLAHLTGADRAFVWRELVAWATERGLSL